MLHTAICEDCPQQMQAVLDLLNAYNAGNYGTEIQSRGFSSGEELLSALDSGSAFDLFLLDIMMPGLTGIQLAQELRKRNGDIPIVFLTSSADYALDAFRVSAFQYILKPVGKDELFPVLDRIISIIKRESEQFFMLSMTGRIVKVPYSSIVCVESIQRTLRMHLENGTTLDSKTLRMPFSVSIAPLFRDSRFLCAHKSFVLNMAWVEELTSDSFIMKNDVRVPIPRYRYADAKSKYFAYLSGRGIGVMGGS